MKLRLTLIAAIAILPCIAVAQTGIPAPSPSPVAAPDYLAEAGITADPVTQAANLIISSVTRTADENYKTVSLTAHILWKDPTKAQAIVDAMGEHAGPIFVTYGAFVGPLGYISPAKAAVLPAIPAGYNWTILPATAKNADGSPAWPVGQRSVVITYTPPAASPTPTPAS